MNAQTAVLTCLRNYFSFQGRARRAEFWYFALFCAMACIAAVVTDATLGTAILSTIIWLGLAPPYFAAMVRRLHDRGLSGKWVLVVLVPGIGWIILLVTLAQQGMSGPNDYGPDPRAYDDFARTRIPQVPRN